MRSLLAALPFGGLILPALGLLAPAAAQSLPPGFYLRGETELEYLSGQGSDAVALRGDVSFGLAPVMNDHGIGFGFDLGVDFLTDDATTYDAVYGTLVLGTRLGTFGLGVPRPAMEDYIDLPRLGGSVLLDEALTGILTGRSYTGLTYKFADDRMWGARYDGRFDRLAIGLSAHRFDAIDVTAYTLGATYDFGDLRVMLGIEHADTGGGGDTNHAFGATYRRDRFDIGLLFSRVNLIGSTEAQTLFARYRPTDALELSAVHIAAEGDAAYGISARYTLWRGAYVQAGLIDGDAFGGDRIVDVSLGYRF